MPLVVRTTTFKQPWRMRLHRRFIDDLWMLAQIKRLHRCAAELCFVSRSDSGATFSEQWQTSPVTNK
jgi:hypothetical protein